MKCSKLAAEITQNGIHFKTPIAPKFKKLATFLQSRKDGPKLPITQSISIAKELILEGPMATENFIQAFKFATSKKGLKLSYKMAIDFAQKMAKRSVKKN